MLVYDDLGAGDPIVFLHGIGSCRKAWSPQHELSSRYRLIIPDLRGHGDTQVSGDISSDGMADDVIHLMDSLGIEQFGIVGLSMGGIVGQRIVHKVPNRVTKIVLANTCNFISELFSLPEIKEREKRVKSMTEEQYVDSVLKGCCREDEDRDAFRHAFHIRKKDYIESLYAFSNVNYLSALDTKVMIIASMYDLVTPVACQILLLGYNPCAGFRLLPTGHLSNLENPELFNSIVIEFMGGDKGA